jgi:6-phosphogluconolactonase
MMKFRSEWFPCQLLLILCALVATLAKVAHCLPPDQWVYIGTYTGGESEGIYLLKLDSESGDLEKIGLAGKTDNPSFLAIHPTRPFLYATGTMPAEGGKNQGCASSFRIEADGRLTPLDQAPSIGEGPCHVAVDRAGRHILLANYGGGSVTAIALQKDGTLGDSTAFIQHEGSSVNASRQEKSHAHNVALDEAGKHVFVSDLGIDQVKIYDFDDHTGKLTPNDPPEVSLAPGAGPRHFAFHPSGKFAFVINELDSTVTAFDYHAESGRLEPVATSPTLPEGFSDPNTTAEIRVHPNGRWVYGSNRGHDSIATFEFDADKKTLRPLGHTSTEGSTPRNFNLDPSGNFLLAANQESGTVVVLKIDQETGIPEATGKKVEVPKPVCVLFMDPAQAR